jgi:hypothetical protein
MDDDIFSEGYIDRESNIFPISDVFSIDHQIMAYSLADLCQLVLK